MIRKIRTVFSLLFTGGLFFGCTASHGAAIPGDDMNMNTAAAARTLQLWYNHQGLWDTTGWWNGANCLAALENVMVANNGQVYLDVLTNTFKRNAGHHFLNDYYDDEGWWALAWIHAYDLTGKLEYLQMAKTIFNDMTGGWSDHCGGGLSWRKSLPDSRNAIQNELFLLVAVRLHQRTPADGGANGYFEWAMKEWSWFQHVGLINSRSLVNDGLNDDCQNNGGTTWTYNQGVIIGGLTELYKTTGDTNYLAQAIAIADATIATLVNVDGVLKEPCEDRGCGGGDVPQFKGVFIRYLADLYDETHRPAYREFLLKNARSVWANDRDDANHLGLKWGGPFDAADAARQSSAIMALSALAEPVTKALPFCKGAASVTFGHATGAASGDLAWTCTASNAPEVGVMLSGACASLPAGKHTVHFRMMVGKIKNSPDNLVRLAVNETATGTSIASRQISWNSFAAASQPADFTLAFTNATNQAPLEFQVYWNGLAAAPDLTLTDVTVDGAQNWTAANLAHEVGRLDALNGWEADPVRDHVSGCLVKNSGLNDLSGGNCSADFELKVDNFNRDNLKVATLLIMDSDTGEVVASREVRRNEFPDVCYHVFTLNFRAAPGRRHDFKTLWHYAAGAPRLTQRSLVVRSQTAKYSSN